MITSIQFPTCLSFFYINWKGKRHHYLVQPQEIVFEAYGFAPKAWILRAKVIKRDNILRHGIRSFKLIGLMNVEEVNDETR